MKMKLSVVGKGPGWEGVIRDADRQIWCVSTVFEKLRLVDVQPDRIFQLHGKDLFEPWIEEEQFRVVLAKYDPEFPLAKVLPSQELIKIHGPKFASTFVWMIALAIGQGFTDINIHGVHLAHYTEYGSQRDSFFYFYGYAESLGVKINVPENSGLHINQAYGVLA